MLGSFNYITNKIIEIECLENLFEWEVNGIYVWEIIRYKIYNAAIDNNVASKSSVGKYRAQKGKYFLEKVLLKTQKYFNAICLNPYFDREQVDVLIFESSRKLLFENVYIDPYTKFTCDEIIKEGLKVTKYQSSYNYDKLAKRDFKTKHLDLPYLVSKIKGKFLKQILSSSDQVKIKKIQKIILDELQVDVDLQKLIVSEIKLFKCNNRFFKSLLANKKPQQIYIANFCDKTALISAAKSYGIQVIDIQHGLISSDDIIYHYPNIKEESLRYFPDKFYAWSLVWQKVCKLPLKSENIIDYGNKYLQNQKNKYSHLKKKKDQILVVSQPSLTKIIALEILKNEEFLKQYQLFYKLHPNEYDQVLKPEELNILRKKSNIIFVDKYEDLYKILAETSYVIGVGSTVLIEALSFDCKVFLFDLPSVEWMIPFINGENVVMFNQEFKKVR